LGDTLTPPGSPPMCPLLSQVSIHFSVTGLITSAFKQLWTMQFTVRARRSHLAVTVNQVNETLQVVYTTAYN